MFAYMKVAPLGFNPAHARRLNAGFGWREGQIRPLGANGPTVGNERSCARSEPIAKAPMA